MSSNRKRWRRKLKNRVLTESNYLLPIPIHRVKKKVDYPICEARSERWERKAKTRIAWKLRFDFASVPSFLALVATTARRTTMSKRQRLRLFLTRETYPWEFREFWHISLEKYYANLSHSQANYLRGYSQEAERNESLRIFFLTYIYFLQKFLYSKNIISNSFNKILVQKH